MKKIIASTVAALMLAASFPALGAAGISAEEAIAAAKTALPIPEELTEFSYGYDEDGYNLNWRDTEYEKSASAVVSKDGIILAYSIYDGTDRRGLSRFRKSELQQIAADFLKTVIPELADKLVLSDESSYRNIVFDRYENGVRVEGNQATVYMNTVAGTVQDYSLSWDFENSFEGESKLTSDEALAALSENAVKLEYSAFWNDDKQTAFPVYRRLSGIYINAGDGSVLKGSSNTNNNKYMMTADAAEGEVQSLSGGSSGYRLTTQEITEVETMKNLISKEQAAEKISSLTELWLPENYELTISYYTYKSSEKTTYTATARCDWEDGYARITMDAQSGEIKSISVSRDDAYNKPENPVPDESCEAVADGFINKIKDLSEYRPSDDQKSNDRNYIKSYIKYIGEIPYPEDSKTVYVSKNSGQVLSYYENVSEAEIVIPEAIADKLEAVKKNYSAELVYTYNEEGASVLAYTLKPNADFYFIKAEDGSAVDYSGEIISDSGEKADEAGHWAWEVFDVLRENDIYVSGSYSLDDAVKREDFVYLIQRVSNISSSIPYRYYNDDEADGSAPITREEAVEIVMMQMGWEKLINLDVFTTKFADEADFAGGIGGAAILQGLGIIRGDGVYFFPARSLTYGEAYSVAYNLAVMEENDGEDDGVEPLEVDVILD